MRHFLKFDNEGKMIASVLWGVHIKTEEDLEKYLEEGYLEISHADYMYYVGNRGQGDNGTGYVRGADGKPTSAPAHVTTIEEQVAAVEAEYGEQIEELKTALSTATLAGDDELIEELKEEYTELMAEYQKALADLEGEE